MRFRASLVGVVVTLGLAGPGVAAPLAKDLFGAVAGPTAGAPQAIGDYAKGCASGLVELPETGPTWQAMRLSRNRHWGQPVLVAFVEDLSAYATQLGWAGLYVGDMSQPRGGPMKGGHASHQTGLDVDIWYLPPKRLNLSAGEREALQANNLRSADQTQVTAAYTPAHAALLRAAASDPRVDRIFVTPPIKIALCAKAKASDRAWLQKIRPLYGHNDHFHVRLKCPAGSPACKVQSPTVDELSKGGDGCDESLTWWVTTYLEELKHPPKTKGPKKKTARDFTMADLPKQCAKVLAAE
jgi:penicillin-insensitive murein endopeptidase